MNSFQERPFEGKWKYRSFKNEVNDPETTDSKGAKSAGVNGLLFGEGTLTLKETSLNTLEGTLGGPGWELKLKGSINYGDPYTIRFQGTGIVINHPWIYSYVGYLVNPWVNGVDQVPAIVGSVVRVIDHPGGDGTMHHAGKVASFYAVKYLS
jgi:hypothetical protein